MKKLWCFLPALIVCIFYAIMAIPFDLEISAYVVLALLILAGAILTSGKWWGCFAGIIPGIWLMIADLKETGQIIRQWPIGLAIIIYFIVIGIRKFKTK